MQCVICGQGELKIMFHDIQDFEYGTSHLAGYGRCARCGTVAQHPLPERSLIPSFYPPTYRNYQAGSKGLFSLLKKIQQRSFVRRLSNVIGNRDSKILEIGCGSGDLLFVLKQAGYGCLFGSDLAVVSGEQGGVRFVRGNVEEKFPYEEVFDVIIMINVLEHFLDPLAVLKACRDHLSPGGQIIILTPNANSLALSVFGRHWAGLHAPRHIFLFTNKSLEELGKKIGMSKVKYKKAIEPGQWSISIQNILQDTSFGKAKLKNGLAWYANILSIVLMPFALVQNLTSRPASVFGILEK